MEWISVACCSNAVLYKLNTFTKKQYLTVIGEKNFPLTDATLHIFFLQSTTNKRRLDFV